MSDTTRRDEFRRLVSEAMWSCAKQIDVTDMFGEQLLGEEAAEALADTTRQVLLDTFRPLFITVSRWIAEGHFYFDAEETETRLQALVKATTDRILEERR